MDMDANLPIPGTAAGGVRRESSLSFFAREALLVLLGTVFLALTARISVALPFTPVPVSGQTLGVLLVGSVYGWRRGVLTVLAYLAEGAAGLPVFAGGAAGPLVLAGPTGGYLAGFVPAAALAGLLGTARQRVPVRIAGMLLASAVVYVFGAGRLVTLGVPPERVLAVGVLPFVLGDVLKSGLAAAVTPAGAQALGALGIRQR